MIIRILKIKNNNLMKKLKRMIRMKRWFIILLKKKCNLLGKKGKKLKKKNKK